MNLKAGGRIFEGQTYIWTDWGKEAVEIGISTMSVSSFVIPADWLADCLDDTLSALLCPMPVQSLN